MTNTPDSGFIKNGTHHFPVRIYYESTDAVGVTYYAEYLRFAERARTEFLRLCGIDQIRLSQDQNCSFVVRHAALDYVRASKLDDSLMVETTLEKIEGVRLHMRQDIKKNDAIVVAVRTQIVCIYSDTQRPCRIPETVLAALRQGADV